jgi:hypothetical protein
VIGARRKKGLLEALALMMTNDVAPMVVEEKLLLWSSLANFVFFLCLLSGWWLVSIMGVGRECVSDFYLTNYLLQFPP